MSTRTRRDWVLWGALGCALIATAHAEYTLAMAAGFNEYVALAVPGALDLYVIRALQQRRDVLVAVLAMVAANVSSHLIGADVLQVGWQVYSATGALAPLILWRVYSLKNSQVSEAGAVSAPAPEAGTAAPDRVPDWMTDEYPPSAPALPEYTGGAVPYLQEVPALPASVPAEYTQVQTHSPVLQDEDWEHLQGASEYVHSCKDLKRTPTVRGLKLTINVGQAKAERLLEHLGERKKRSE